MNTDADTLIAADPAGPALPEGWSMKPRIHFHDSVMHPANGPGGRSVALYIRDDGSAYWESHGRAPLVVYAALLRAAGVVL